MAAQRVLLLELHSIYSGRLRIGSIRHYDLAVAVTTISMYMSLTARRCAWLAEAWLRGGFLKMGM